LTNSAAAAQLWSPPNAYRGPLWQFIKTIRLYGTFRGPTAFTTKYLNFYFVLFHYFLVQLTDTISVEPSPESVQLGVRVCAMGLSILKIYI